MEMERRSSMKKEEEKEMKELMGNYNYNYNYNMVKMVLRVLGFVLSLVAAIVVGLNKQTKVVPASFNLPPLDFTFTAHWNYLSALVYLLATNIIACSYSFISLFLLLKNKNKDNILAFLIVVLDTVMVALLFSSSGAGAAVGVIAYHGNSHVQWGQVCNIYGRFCKQMAASTVLSLAGAVVFMLLVVLASVDLQKRPN